MEEGTGYRVAKQPIWIGSADVPAELELEAPAPRFPGPGPRPGPGT